MERLISIFTCLLISLITISQTAPKNFHEVEEGSLYRSGQFHRKNITVLKDHHIGVVLNLRNRINDSHELRGSGIEEVRVRMRAKHITVEDVVEALSVIINSKNAVLVHCYHGSDRTGCIVACYRMAVQGWSKEEAIAEFEQKELGYNETFFPNIREFLENIDVQSLRRALSL